MIEKCSAKIDNGNIIYVGGSACPGSLGKNDGYTL